MTPAENVRDVLGAAGYLDGTLPVTVACRVIAAAILDGASVQRIAELLDAHGIALEDHPDTRVIAAELIQRVEEARDS